MTQEKTRVSNHKKTDMTDINPFLRHLLRFEAGVADRNLSTDKLFQKAHVKGFANDPDDRGGATMIGVTLAAFTAWRKQHGRPAPTVKELKALSYEEWRDIVEKDFWQRCKADELKSQSVAMMLADFTFHSGAHGIKALQRVLAVKVDGIMGAQTLSSANATPPATLFAALKAERLRFLQLIVKNNPRQKKFIKGWITRVEALSFTG